MNDCMEADRMPAGMGMGMYEGDALAGPPETSEGVQGARARACNRGRQHAETADDVLVQRLIHLPDRQPRRSAQFRRCKRHACLQPHRGAAGVQMRHR